jgi:competence protein ComEC
MTLVWLALAWAGGIVLAHALWTWGVLGCGTPHWPLCALAAAAGAVALAGRRRAAVRLAGVLLAFLMLGAWRYLSQPIAACPSPNALSTYHASAPLRAAMVGVVEDYPDLRDRRTYYRLRAERLLIDEDERVVTGSALVALPRYPAYAYGDRLRVTGVWQTPPVYDDFDYRTYLAVHGVHTTARAQAATRLSAGQGKPWLATLYEVRSRASRFLNRSLPEPAAALANGILLGIEGGIPPAVDEAYAATGASHIIVISGSNIALMTGALLAGLALLVGRRRAVWPVALILVLYVLLTGADPAAVRAGVMGLLLLGAVLAGRESTAYVALCGAALLMLALDPRVLWDAGFRLSFAATLGLVVLTRPFATWMDARLTARFPGAAGRTAGLTGFLAAILAAQVAVAPLLVDSFGRLSTVSILTNALILPVQPPLMASGLLGVLAGLVWEPLGRWIIAIPGLLIGYCTAVVGSLAQLPFASIPVGSGSGWAAPAAYLLAAPALLWVWLRRSGRIAAAATLGRAAAAAAATLAAIALAAILAAALPDGRLHITFLPGDWGDAALVETPSGRRALVWSGNGTGPLPAGATRGGLDLLVAPASRTGVRAADRLDPVRLAVGATIGLGDGVTLQRVAAGDGLALRLDYGSFSTLLPTQLAAEAQAALATADPLPLALWVCPPPDTGIMPVEDLIAMATPQVVVRPEGAAYPPGVEAAFGAAAQRRVPEGAMLEAVSDGRRIWLISRRVPG